MVPLRYTADHGPAERLKNDLAMAVRRRVFATFMRECAPVRESRVADFGISGQRGHPVHYFFETLYPHADHLTAIGRESEGARWYPEQFPGLTYLEADLRAIPVPDDYFDAGLCNAVVEHGGPRDDQAALVQEVCRVCRRVLFATPNKAFPIELHTFLPLVHWLPDRMFRAILRGLRLHYLARVEDLNLLDAPSFLSLFPAERENRLIGVGLPLLRSNLMVVSRRRSAR